VATSGLTTHFVQVPETVPANGRIPATPND
jgi:hypothetical protein